MTRLLVVALLLLVPAAATPAQGALPQPKAYANCKALNAVYRHGVARSATTVDSTRSGSSAYLVTNFTVDAKTYALNTERDRDHDGIACEKR